MRARRSTLFLVGLAAAASTALAVAPAVGAEEGSGEPGMCSGRSDAGMTLNAHAHGTPKFILNLETDASGEPDGVLILGRGSSRVYVDDLCRFWQHLPGQEPGHGEPGHEDEGVVEGATTAHAVGTGVLADGTRVLVRTDVRETDEGRFFRVRYRAMGGHADAATTAAAAAGDEHEDEAWTRVPAEGWAPLDQLNLR